MTAGVVRDECVGVGVAACERRVADVEGRGDVLVGGGVDVLAGGAATTLVEWLDEGFAW